MDNASTFKSSAEVIHEERTRLFQQPETGGRPLSALCFSGGGIRSATFNLGVIQGLAKCRLLDKFDYLSTVSGGGYIGGWLTTWTHHLGGIGAVQDALGANAAPKADGRPEPAQIRHLRNYSNYLTPRLGIASADGLVAAATWLRNLLLNGLQIWPLIIAILILPLIVSRLAVKLSPQIPAAFGALLMMAGGACLIAALVSQLRRLKFEGSNGRSGNRRLRGRTDGIAPGYTLPMTISMGLLLAGWTNVVLAGGQGIVRWALGGHGLHIFGVLLLVFAVATGLARLMRRAQAGEIPPGRRTLVLALTAALASAAIESQLIYLTLTFDPLWRWTGQIEGVGEAARLLGVANTWAAPDYPPATWRSLLFYLILAYPLMLALQVFSNWIFTGSTSRLINDASREWLARADGIQLGIAGGLAAWFAISFTSPLIGDWLLGNFTVRSDPWAWLTTALGPVVSALGVWFAQSARTDGTKGGTTADSGVDKVINLLGRLAIPLAAILILVTLAYGGYALINAAAPRLLDPTAEHTIQTINREPLPHAGMAGNDPLCAPEWTQTLCVSSSITLHEWLTIAPSPGRDWIVLAGLLLAGWIAGSVFNVNRYSLFGFYRERLARAYLGGARTNDRTPDAFTHFDPHDNYPLAEAVQRPLHIINAAINLGNAGELSWQERRAMSFTFSPLYCGAADLDIRQSPLDGAFRPTVEYAAGITLADAIAISGAAANPNMGYHNSPAISFLLSLCNVRLGAWFGNPAGSTAWQYKYPGTLTKPSGIFMLQEAIGRLSSWSSWLNLSDGGHFENLGVYEMVRRGCKLMVVGDASADGLCNYDDLGRAFRLIRTDFGVEFAELLPNGLPAEPCVPDDTAAAQRRWRLFRIDYPAGFDTPGSVDWHPELSDSDRFGYLLYFKTCQLGDEPQDIRYYAATAPDFPHETTGDQFFSESQFESYRKLGEFTVMSSIAGALGQDDDRELLLRFFNALEKAANNSPA